MKFVSLFWEQYAADPKRAWRFGWQEWKQNYFNLGQAHGPTPHRAPQTGNLWQDLANGWTLQELDADVAGALRCRDAELEEIQDLLNHGRATHEYVIQQYGWAATTLHEPEYPEEWDDPYLNEIDPAQLEELIDGLNKMRDLGRPWEQCAAIFNLPVSTCRLAWTRHQVWWWLEREISLPAIVARVGCSYRSAHEWREQWRARKGDQAAFVDLDAYVEPRNKPVEPRKRKSVTPVEVNQFALFDFDESTTN